MATQRPILKTKTTKQYWLFNYGTVTYRFAVGHCLPWQQERWVSAWRGAQSFTLLNKFAYPPMEGLAVGDRFEIEGELIEVAYQNGRAVASRLIEQKAETFEMVSEIEAKRVLGA